MNDSHEILIEWIKIEAIKRFGDNQNYTENDNEIKKWLKSLIMILLIWQKN